MSGLNLALISGLAAFESTPASAFPRAEGYQVPVKGAFAKFCRRVTGAADPSVPEKAVQGRVLSQLARIVIFGPLVSVAPQIFAANWKAFSRCWPRVVPLLPPTGATGVLSLNPVPGASTSFRISMVACPYADDAATRLTAIITRENKSFIRTFLITLLRVRLSPGTVGLDRVRIDSEESTCRARVIYAGLCNAAVLVDACNSHTLKTTLKVHIH